jgi:CRISPR-associated endonuclease/helicase Cas3
MDQQIEQIIAHIATVSGRSHDLGKNTVFFQKKLRDKGKAQAKDPIRHEWLSYLVLAFMRQRQSFDEAFAQSIALLSKPKKLDNQKPDWFKSLSTPWDVVEAVVATHHKLFAGKYGLEIHHHAPVVQEPAMPPVDARMFSALDLSFIDDLKETIQSISSPNHPLFWRYVTLRARQAMILADHLVSAQTPPRQAKKKEPMANSKTQQPLDWHLKTVGQVAGDVARNMHRIAWPCLDQETVERILQPSDDPRFVWQDHAKEALQCANPLPTLVFNMAGTGSGKTRANVKIICALRGKHDVRFTTALNLRTLTLQTADAYRDETGIPEHDLICVIGEKTIRDLHEQSRIEDDEEEDEADSEVILSSGHPPPEFLDALKHYRHQTALFLNRCQSVCVTIF